MFLTMMLVTAVGLLPPSVELDFATSTTGQAYRIDVVVRDATGVVLVSGPVNLGAKAGAGDLRDALGDSLGDSGLLVLSVGDTKLRLVSSDGTRLGSITYDTFANGAAIPAIAGPKVVWIFGPAKVFVNGIEVRPAPPKK